MDSDETERNPHQEDRSMNLQALWREEGGSMVALINPRKQAEAEAGETPAAPYAFSNFLKKFLQIKKIITVLPGNPGWPKT